MHGLCIRSLGIVSPPSQLWFRFAALPSQIHPISIQNICHSRPLSIVTARTSHFSHGARRAPVTPESEYEFTSTQVARAASRAVRLAIRERNVRNAFYAVDTMLHSSSDAKIKPSLAAMPASVVTFGRRLPSRLAAHSLVHGLIRQDLMLEAGLALQKLMSIGVRFHTRTIETNVRLLCSDFSRSQQEEGNILEQTINPSSSWGDSDAGIALASQSTRLRPETQLASNILDTARKSRRPRTESMYSRLINACLLQGEIIVATLLFVILVKDWQLRKAIRPTISTLEEMDGVIPMGRTQDRIFEPTTLMHAKRLGFHKANPRLPYPDKRMLQNILNSINHHILSRDTEDIVRLRSIESLSMMANLLRDRCLPFGQIAPLLRALQNCPSSPPCNTGVLRNGAYVDVNVYDYVHTVLLEYCVKPSSAPEPDLDLRAYNSLIHYALHHRQSPALADKVIKHMTVHRKPPISPDIVTYNTLLRCSSLLNRNDLASQVIEKLRQRKENSNHIISRTAPSISGLNGRLKQEKLEKLISLSKRIQNEKMNVPDFAETQTQALLHADLYTLSSYITHLVSVGLSDLVADMIFELLPELHVVDHPTGNLAPALEWTDKQREERREECIARAMKYGPFVFSALLNALRKAGRTGLAERVWLLAQQAERASWISRTLSGSVAPWCLPIHAYTSMMQCYANESKKGLACIRGTRFANSLSSSLYAMRQESPWVPQQDKTGKIYVMGWAYFFLKTQASAQGLRNPEPTLRVDVSRAVGSLLLRSMRNGAISVWRELMLVQSDQVRHFPPQWAAQLNSLELPIPDARFFNAALDILGRRPNMQARRLRSTSSWWNRKLRLSQRLFATTGWLSTAYDTTLIEIARRMAQAGFSLPIGLQRALVGRVNCRVSTVTRRVDVRPWAFPPPLKRNFQPFSLPATRTRGLPLGRRRSFNGHHRRRQTRSRKGDIKRNLY